MRLALLMSGVALVTLSLLAFALLMGAESLHFTEGVVLTSLGLSVVAGSALISWGVAPNTVSGCWAAAGTLSASFWAFSVGFAQYFSTCRWVSWLDLAIVFIVCALALARIYRIKLGPALLRFALPLALSLAVGHLYGTVARGLEDDPTM